MKDGMKLTVDLHRDFKEKGYKFILITGTVLDRNTNTLSHLDLAFVKEIPAVLHYSCTGIDDAMILDILHKSDSISIYVDTERQNSL